MLEPLDDDLDDWYRAYSYCKLFHTSLAEYDSRPYVETLWMLKIDQTQNEAMRELQEKADAR